MPFLKEISGKFENGNIIVYDSEISLATHHVAQGGVALIKDLVPESYLKEVIDYNSTFVQSFENSKCNDSYCNWARLDFENEKSETMRCFRISHFGDVEGLSNIIPSNIKNLFNQLLKLQNNITGNNFSFFSQNKDFFVTPQILHYPANGGYLDTHSHPFLPQKIGIILCLKSSDIGGGSTYFETSNGRFDTGNYHKAGDLLMFKYDQPHGVTSVGSRGEVDWSLDSGRISLIFPVKSCS